RLLGLGRHRQAQIAGRDGLDTEGAQQHPDLAHLAGVVAGDDQPPAGKAPAHASALCCASTSSMAPLRARRIMPRNSSSEKTEPPPAHRSSTRPPLPVITKFPSVPASLSSA